MPVEIEINSKQIFEDSTDGESNKCEGVIVYHNKGAVLEFTEKYEDQELKFKMTILENKIITLRNNQKMIFDLQNKNKTTLNTPYGEFNMTIITKKIDIVKIENEIKQIHLGYDIELENGVKYYNIVDIIIKEK